MNYIEEKYKNVCNTPSDINEHLPVLFKYAKDCDTIIECGVRYCISSWALIYGLLCGNGGTNKKLILNDINLDKCNLDELISYTTDLPIEIKYACVNDLDLQIEHNYDMVFIDTWHVYGQLKRELNKFAPITNKYIIMHDTTVDEIYGETIRMNLNANLQSIQTGIPLNEINCGLGKAIYEFLELNHNDWELIEKLTNNNGLTVLKRKNI